MFFDRSHCSGLITCAGSAASRAVKTISSPWSLWGSVGVSSNRLHRHDGIGDKYSHGMLDVLDQVCPCFCSQGGSSSELTSRGDITTW